MFEFNKSNNSLKQRAYEIIYNAEQGITQQEISSLMGLTTASIGNILPELERINLIQNSGLGQSRGGRRPVIYKVNPDRFYIVGLSIGLEYSVLLITNLKGNIVHKEMIYYKANENVFATLEKFVDSVRKLIEVSSIEYENILGVGISSPGPVDTKSGVILTPHNLPNWRMVNICHFFERELELPVYLEKDANAMALSEVVFGNGKKSQNSLFVKVDYGIGYGIVINGKIYRGKSGAAGEVGESDVEETSYAVFPDVKASGRALVLKAKELNITSTDFSDGEVQLIKLIEASKSGDTQYKQLFLESAKQLAIGLTNKINFLNPEMVVLGGRIAEDVTDYYQWIMEYTYSMVLKQHGTDVKFLRSTFGDASEALGATTVLLQHMFYSSKLKAILRQNGNLLSKK